MSKLPFVKSRELIAMLKKIGFVEHHKVGSHFQFKHSDGRRTTISVHRGKDIPRGTLGAILNQIKISPQEFVKLLKR